MEGGNENNRTVVTVTGASGYIASHIVKQLLEEGYDVRGTIRKKGSKTCAHLTLENLFPEGLHSGGKLTLYEADLLEDRSFDEAIDGARYVIHTASPVILENKSSLDPYKDLVEPALNGLINVFNSILRCDTVERVVYTSSTSAITEGALDRGKNYVYSEKDWNDMSTPKTFPYPYAKTLAEKKAWEIAEENQGRFELVVVNPSIVMGKSLSGRMNDGSMEIMMRFFNGMFIVAPHYSTALVSMDDVVRAVLLVMRHPDAKGRYILSERDMWIKEIAEVLKPEFGRYPLVRLEFPKCFFALTMSCTGLGPGIVANINVPLKYDNSKIQNELGFQFSDVREAILEMAHSFVEQGLVKDRRRRVVNSLFPSHEGEDNS